MISKSMRHMKRSSVEPWIENVGGTGCLEPAFEQNTNDDDELSSKAKLIVAKNGIVD